MKKRLRTVAVFLCLLVMTFAAAGCRKEQSGQTNRKDTSKDYVYKMTALPYDSEESQMSSLFGYGSKYYAYGYVYFHEDGTASAMDLWTLNADGSIQEKNQILLEENSSLNSFASDGKGNIFAVKNVYRVNEETQVYEDLYYLLKLTEQGEEVFCVELNSMPELSGLNTQDYFYAGTLMAREDAVYINVMGSYAEFDTDGNFVKILEGKDGTSFENVTLYPLKNGKVVAVMYEDTGIYASYLDMETCSFSEKYKLPGISYEYSIYAGEGYDLFLVNDYGVYGYNVGDEEKVQLLDYIGSDLGIYSIYNILPISETEFFGTYDDVESYEMTIGRFTKVKPEEVKDKKVIVLACTGIDWEIRTEVIKFNKENEEYRITIQDYSSMYDTEENYLAGLERLHTDIMAGKVPDILMVSGSMPFDSYISKGLMEDLKPYIEKDEELNINQFMPNIIEAYSVNGKLYSLVPSYMINTMVAKTADVGKERGWTVQDAMDLMAEKPEGTELLSYVTRDTMLVNSLTVAGNQFIDRENGKCNFDSEDFILFLEFLKQFPEEYEDTEDTDDFWENYDSMWREGKVIAMLSGISDFGSYNQLKKGTFGEEITLIGYPSGNEDGSAIMANFQFAMFTGSAYKEGAWEFMRYFVTDEYQNELSYGLPLSIKRLDELGEEAMKMPTYMDEEGNEVEMPDTYYVNGLEIPIDPMTAEEVEAFKKELYSFTNVYTYDEDLVQIVREEAAPYFAGQKSAEEVAKIIQSRAQIYVNESR